MTKKHKADAALQARALDDDDMFKAKAPLVRTNAGGMPASIKKVLPLDRPSDQKTIHILEE